MDERIKITTRKMRDGSYRSEVWVNGDFYASSRSETAEKIARRWEAEYRRVRIVDTEAEEL